MNESIFYNSPIGILQITNTGDAISEVSFVDTEKKKRIDTTGITYSLPCSAIVRNCIEQLEDYFEGKDLTFNLQLSQEGTPFQQSVWTELQKIRYGNTVSYLHLSKVLGNVKAIRAVGTANGKNNIAIIVPCHRVIGSNGSLVGYVGDLWRKKWLLQHEARHANGVQTLF